MVTLTLDNVRDTIAQNEIVMVCIQAPARCGWCQRFQPLFDHAARRHPDLVFSKIDCDDEPELSHVFQTQPILPTLGAVKQGVQVLSMHGGPLSAQQLADVIRDVRALDVDRFRSEALNPQRAAPPGVILGARGRRGR